MRSAPTLKIWITPFSSVAMLEKLALFRIAFCRAPVLSTTSLRRTSVMTAPATESASIIAFCSINCFLRDVSAEVMLQTRGHFREDDRLGEKGIFSDLAATHRHLFFRDDTRQKHNRHGFQF